MDTVKLVNDLENWDKKSNYAGKIEFKFDPLFGPIIEIHHNIKLTTEQKTILKSNIDNTFERQSESFKSLVECINKTITVSWRSEGGIEGQYFMMENDGFRCLSIGSISVPSLDLAGELVKVLREHFNN